MGKIIKIFHFFIPPDKWILPVSFILGIFCGLGLFVLYISNASSYLSDEPNACINCHVMVPQYVSWERSSHKRIANCNDCHVPQDSIIKKYAFKATDGLRHATLFTFRMEDQVIRIKEAGKQVVQSNCIRCHEELFTNIKIYNSKKNHYNDDELCIKCHKDVPHGDRSSLSSVPYARIPKLNKPIPKWLEDFIEDEK